MHHRPKQPTDTLKTEINDHGWEYMAQILSGGYDLRSTYVPRSLHWIPCTGSRRFGRWLTVSFVFRDYYPDSGRLIATGLIGLVGPRTAVKPTWSLRPYSPANCSTNLTPRLGLIDFLIVVMLEFLSHLPLSLMRQPRNLFVQR